MKSVLGPPSPPLLILQLVFSLVVTFVIVLFLAVSLLPVLLLVSSFALSQIVSSYGVAVLLV